MRNPDKAITQFTNSLLNLRVLINEAMDSDSEITLLGNGVNAFEANSVLKYIEEELKEALYG